jgi:tripartite ATP-independent transporter DctM subunit
MNMWIFFALFIAILMLKGSVAFAMLFCSAAYMVSEGLSLELAAQRLVAGANSFVLLAIPFFILAGNIMNTGGITEKIFGFANKAVGFIPGGLGHANVLASVIFAGMSGSAVADAAGLGQIEIKAMKDSGYEESFAVAITGASAIIGPIIPPSIPMVIYGVAASVSIGQLFIAGIVPGILMAICLSIMIFIECLIKKYPREKWSGFQALFKSFWEAFLSILTPVIILGSMFSGIVTPTEAAVVAVIYSFALAFGYKRLTLKEAKNILIKTVNTTVPIMAILCAAQAFGWVMAKEQIPQMLLKVFDTYIHSPAMALLVINILLLAVGCFMEAGAAIIILVPVLLPIITNLGIDPVHFGVVMVLNLMIGLLTPPVGIVLYVLQGVSGIKFKDIVLATRPYLIALVMSLIIVTYVPDLVLYLPRIFFNL